MSAEFPEDDYRSGTPAERRRIRAQVLAACAGERRNLIWRLPVWHREEAAQVAALGVLVALEKYDANISGPDRGKKRFWNYAFVHVREELRTWADRALGWQNTKMNAARRAAREAKGQTTVGRMLSLELELELDARPDLLVADDTPEGLASDLEAAAALNEFLTTLSAEEKRTLLSENENVRKSRLHVSLRERAAAVLTGAPSGHLATLRKRSDSIRP